MNSELGGVGGVSHIFQRVSCLWLQSRWGKHHIRRFFLLVGLYESHSQATRRAVHEQVERWRPEVESLVQMMGHVRSKNTREEANQLAEEVCASMLAIIENELRLNPAEHDSIREHWRKAKEHSRVLEEARINLPTALSGNIATSVSMLVSSSSAFSHKLTVYVCLIGGGPEYTFGVPSSRRLAFPVQFIDYSLCPLIVYALTHPREHAERNVRPIAIQAMDTLYLRYLEAQQSSEPAVWGPIDPCSPVTLRNYTEKCDSQVQVRFVSARIRFLLVSTYQRGQHFEGIFDLDSSEQRDKLIEALIQGQIDTATTRAPASAATGVGSAAQALPDGTPFRDIRPRTSIILKGPSHYAKFHPMHPNVNDLSFIR